MAPIDTLLTQRKEMSTLRLSIYMITKRLTHSQTHTNSIHSQHEACLVARNRL